MMGLEHIASIAHIEGATVTAYADPHPDSRTAAATLAEHARGFEDHRGMLESGLCDAVVIATPNHTHADILLEALATDVHVLVEKPLCTTVEDCRRVIRAAQERSAITWVGLEYRYIPAVARLIDEVRRGTVGEVAMVAIREHRFPFLQKIGDWNRFNRATGGTLVEKACHFFDLMRVLAGAEPVRVMASGAQRFNHLDESYDGETPDILDNAFVIVDHENGVRSLLDLCMFAEATLNQNEISVVGNQGKVEALTPEMIVRIGRRGRHFIGDVETTRAQDVRITYAGHHHGSCQLEHLEFIAACRGASASRVELSAGLVSVAMGVAAQTSIAEARPVEMSEVL